MAETATGHTTPARSPWLAYVLIIGATIAVSALGGLVSSGTADPWYRDLNKAPGNPPGYVFGIVWPILYALMAFGACWVWRKAGGWANARTAMTLFLLQLVFNLAWSWLFFGANLALAGLVDIVILWGLVAAMILAWRRISPFAAALQVPYLLWLTFATYLNGWIVLNN
jgi:translocator protein